MIQVFLVKTQQINSRKSGTVNCHAINLGIDKIYWIAGHEKTLIYVFKRHK